LGRQGVWRGVPPRGWEGKGCGVGCPHVALRGMGSGAMRLGAGSPQRVCGGRPRGQATFAGRVAAAMIGPGLQRAA
jgi:hypothetical protein